MKICRATTLARCALVLALIVPTLQAASTPQWVEVRSPHFSVITDGGEKRGREVALRFEQMRAVFGTILLKEKVNLPVPLQIIAFRDNRDLRAYAPLWQGKPIELAGLFAPGQDQQYIALDLTTDRNWQAIFHEYAHQLLNGNLQRAQLWFDEGFAEYYSTIRFTSRDVEIGQPPETALRMLRSGRMPLEQLFKVTHHDEVYNQTSDGRSLFYAQSWLVVHYLMDMNLIHQAEQYLDAANSGTPFAEAIRRAFGMEPEQLEGAIDAYLRSGQAVVHRVPLPAGLDRLKLTCFPLNDADARTVLADLHLHSPHYVDQAIEEYRGILKEYPNHAAAHRGLGYALLHRREFEKAGSEFRAAAHNSSDPHVYYYSALLAVQQGRVPREGLDEVNQQLTKAISLNPDFADAYSVLGWTQMTKGETRSAIQSLQRAVELNPGNELYRSNLARCLMADAKYDAAEALLAGLKASANPSVVAAAQGDLAKLQRLRQQYERLQTRQQPLAETAPPKLTIRLPEAQIAPPPALALPTGALEGKLVGITCSPGRGATVTIMSGEYTWKFSTSNRNRLMLTGADSFSCDWQDLSVSVNYRRTGEGVGELLSLSVQ